MDLQGLYIQPRACRDPRIAKTDLTRLSEGNDGILYKMLDPLDQTKYRIQSEREQHEELVKSRMIKENMCLLSGTYKDGQYQTKPKTQGLRFVPPQFGTAKHKNQIEKKNWETDLKNTLGGTNQKLKTKSAKYQSTILELAKNTQYFEEEDEEPLHNDEYNEFDLVKDKYEQNLQVVEKLYREKAAMQKRIKDLEQRSRTHGAEGGDEANNEDEGSEYEDDDDPLPTLSELENLPGDSEDEEVLHGYDVEHGDEQLGPQFILGASLQEDVNKFVAKRRMWAEKDKQAKRDALKHQNEYEEKQSKVLSSKAANAKAFAVMEEREQKAKVKKRSKMIEEIYDELADEILKLANDELTAEKKEKLFQKSLNAQSWEEKKNMKVTSSIEVKKPKDSKMETREKGRAIDLAKAAGEREVDRLKQEDKDKKAAQQKHEAMLKNNLPEPKPTKSATLKAEKVKETLSKLTEAELNHARKSATSAPTNNNKDNKDINRRPTSAASTGVTESKYQSDDEEAKTDRPVSSSQPQARPPQLSEKQPQQPQADKQPQFKRPPSQVEVPQQPQVDKQSVEVEKQQKQLQETQPQSQKQTHSKKLPEVDKQSQQLPAVQERAAAKSTEDDTLRGVAISDKLPPLASLKPLKEQDNKNFTSDTSLNNNNIGSNKLKPLGKTKPDIDKFEENQQKIAAHVRDTPTLMERHDVHVTKSVTQLNAVKKFKDIVKSSGVQDKDPLNEKLFNGSV